MALLGAGCIHPRTAPIAITPRTPPSPPPPRFEHENTLTILTFNVWGLPSWITGARTERYDQIAAELSSRQPHLVLLQEVWNRHALRTIPTNGAWSVVRASDTHSLFRQSGLVTLSQYPVVDAAFHRFRASRLPDSLVTKGALRTTLRLDSHQHINVWNVHLQAGTTASHVRTRQIAQLARWIREAECGQVMDIVGGDFNCTPDSEDYRLLEQYLGNDATAPRARPHLTTFCAPGDPPRKSRTLDYVFVRPRRQMPAIQSNPRRLFAGGLPDQRLSDHYAVEVSLRFETPIPLAIDPMLAAAESSNASR